MNIKIKIINFLQKIGIYIKQYTISEIRNKKFKTIKGTIGKVDYDDAWLLALALHSRNVIDVGCNIGQSAILILLSDTVEKMVCIDPNPLSLAYCAENLILNKLSQKVKFINALALNSIGENVQFFTVGTGQAGSIFTQHAKTASDANSFFNTKTITLDSCIESDSFVPDLIKIDTEGAEYQVLQGCEEISKKQKTKFLVEVHANLKLPIKDNTQNIINWCRNNFYRPWYLAEKKELLSSEAVKNRGRYHLLLLPKNEDFPEYLIHLKQGASLEEV